MHGVFKLFVKVFFQVLFALAVQRKVNEPRGRNGGFQALYVVVCAHGAVFRFFLHLFQRIKVVSDVADAHGRAVAKAAVARFGMSVQPALKHRAVPHVSVHTPEFAISLCIADVI